MNATMKREEDYTLTVKMMCKELGSTPPTICRWIDELGIADSIKRNGKERWYRPETLELLRQMKLPPIGWMPMSELAMALNIDMELIYDRVKRMEKSEAKRYGQNIYLSPDAVTKLKNVFLQQKYCNRCYKPRTNYNRIYREKREEDSQQWAEQPVDESELVTFEGYSLTPDEHVRRLELKNKHERYIPNIVIDNFRNWNVH